MPIAARPELNPAPRTKRKTRPKALASGSLSVSAAALLLLSASHPLLCQTLSETIVQATSTPHRHPLPEAPFLQASTADPVSNLPDSPGTVAYALNPQPELRSSVTPAELRLPANLPFLAQDIPSPVRNPGPRAVPRRSRPSDVIVAPGQIGLPQTPRDRLIGSLRDSIAPFSLIGSLFSASYSHLANSTPNYGVNSPAYGERLGASLLRGTSQKVLSEALMASILHEDIRYYQVGRGNPPSRRLRHAVLQPFVARTQSRRATPNIAKLSGYLEAAALTTAYYPERNRGAGMVFQSFGSSIAGSAVGYIISEYLPDALEFTHLKKISHP